MWKRDKSEGPTTNRRAVIKKRSKTPGVMITQYLADIPDGKTTPDFVSGPPAMTIDEGKLVVFKAVVKGDPKPGVSWRRAKGNLSQKGKFLSKYEESTGECILKIFKVTAAESDSYKCYAENEYGKAVCTVILNVIDTSTNPLDFRKLLRKSKVEDNNTDTGDAETDERFWDAMVKADRKDYERICAEFGVRDIHSVLKKLDDKRERAKKKYKDGGIPYGDDATEKHSLKTAGRTNDLMQKGTGQKQVDEEEDILLSEYIISNVDFVIKIQEVIAEESEDILFACVLTHPLPRIKWMGKGSILEDGDKYSMTVSDHELIHRLLIRDCKQLDKGIYSAVAGNTTCSAWLVVEDERDPASVGKRTAHRTNLAGGAGIDLEKAAKEQQLKYQEEIERILATVKGKQKEGLNDNNSLVPGRRTGIGVNTGAEENQPNDGSVSSETTGSKEKTKSKKSKKQNISGQVDFDKVTEFGDKDSDIDSEGNTDSTGSAKCPKQKQKVHWKQQPSDPKEPTCGNEASDGVESEDTSGYDEHSEKRKLQKAVKRKRNTDPNQLACDNDGSDSGESEDAFGQDENSEKRKQLRKAVKGEKHGVKIHCDNAACDSEASEDASGHDELSETRKPGRKAVKGKRDADENTGPNIDPDDCNKTAGGSDTDFAKRSCRKRKGPVIEDVFIDPGVQFICGLSDVSAIINESAELTCKLSSEDCDGAWFRDGKKISQDDNFIMSQDGAIHKLVIIRCNEEHSGKYRFEADGRKTEAMISVKDPPRFDPTDLSAFTLPSTVKVGHNTIFKLNFVGYEPIKIHWYKEGEELQDDTNTRIEKSSSQSRLLLSRCQRKDTGEIKIKLKNEHGFIEAITPLIVLDKPTPPLGPAEVTESLASCIEFKWRPPKDDGGSPVINYIMERQQVGRKTWKKIGEIPGVPNFRDTDVDHGRKYCYRIRAVTEEGTSQLMETDEMQAGTLAFPGPPAPPKVISAYDDCINISWDSPSNRGGSRVLGYIVEKRKKGSNLWTVVNALDELIKEKKYAVKDVVAGIEYEFRVTAINISGVGEFSNPSEFVFARDPKKPPGKVMNLKLTETSYTHLVLTWTKPEARPGIQDEARGYFVEIRQADCMDWSRCNPAPIITTSFSVKGLRSMDMYWARVISTNDGGDSVPEELVNYVIAMPSPVRPKFTNPKMKSFRVVKAGNSVRITVTFEASPLPNILWLKDNSPVTKRVTISNSDGSSQLLIPSSERSDSGIYSILVKNLAGQETFSTEVRVTDDPKPPGQIQLEENVPGTVTVIWEPSPDEKRDDRLHYSVSKLDSTKRTWTMVADRLFNNKITVCNIMHGKEYHFRVYAKNDMGVSEPSESPIWKVGKQRDKFVVNVPTMKDCDLRCAPTFIVPLKLHTALKGYECYMSCAVRGNPTPRITWYQNHVSINTNTNYLISNTYGVCSMLILSVGPKNMGEYTITAENALGRAECSTILNVRE